MSIYYNLFQKSELNGIHILLHFSYEVVKSGLVKLDNNLDLLLLDAFNCRHRQFLALLSCL